MISILLAMTVQVSIKQIYIQEWDRLVPVHLEIDEGTCMDEYNFPVYQFQDKHYVTYKTNNYFGCYINGE